MRQVLLKINQMLTPDINAIQHAWYNPYTRRNKTMFDCRCEGFETISARIHLWRHGIAWDCDVSVGVDNGWGGCILQSGSGFMHGMSALIRVLRCHFLSYFISHVIKGIKNGCPCFVGIRGTHGFALAIFMRSITARALLSTLITCRQFEF